MVPNKRDNITEDGDEENHWITLVDPIDGEFKVSQNAVLAGGIVVVLTEKEGGAEMKCSKCKGLMVEDNDLGGHDGELCWDIRQWSCPKCGNREDKIILGNRQKTAQDSLALKSGVIGKKRKERIKKDKPE